MKSVKYDYKNQQYLLSPTGKFIEAQDDEAWAEWCKKAMMTERYYYLIYDSNYGHDLENLIGTGMEKEAIEEEIKRITEETLKQHLETASVGNFTFTWDGEEVYFTCEITNINGYTTEIEGKV